jgi:hypothetical protein
MQFVGIALGAAGWTRNVLRTVEPFEHPRIVMSDFACASKLSQ